MRFIVLDENDKLVVEYNQQVVKELLMQYFEVHKDLSKAYDLLCEDLLEKARTTSENR